MKTEHVCMMNSMQAAMAFLLAITDPALADVDKDKIVKLWNDDIMRNRHED